MEVLSPISLLNRSGFSGEGVVRIKRPMACAPFGNCTPLGRHPVPDYGWSREAVVAERDERAFARKRLVNQRIIRSRSRTMSSGVEY